MKKTFFTPGPSQLYSTVPQHMKTALKEDILSMTHRGKKFHEILEQLQNNLRELLQIPKDYQIFFVSSGTEAMEVTIRNCVMQNSSHLINGAFSKRFWEISQQLGKNAKAEIIEANGTINPLELEDNSELICLTHNETSTGAQLPLEFIYDLKKNNPDVLLAVDTVSSMPYVDLDFRLVDIVFFSVQKCFGLPSGLGVIIVSPSALAKSKYLAENNYDVGASHSFVSLLKSAEKFETVETPNVLDLYLLDKVTQDFLDRGIKLLRKATEEKARILYDFFAKQSGFNVFINHKNYRSQTVIVVDVEDENWSEIRQIELENNLVIGRGYGQYKDKQLRIANFFAHSVRDVERLTSFLRVRNY